MSRGLSIDIVSDVMCPWCYIGKRRLEAALALRPDVTAEIRWHPFQLDATIPAEGMDRRAYLERKFGAGDRPAAIYARIGAAGAEEGIPFAFDRIRRSPNTLDAHRLVRWAGEAGTQDAVVEHLFRLYFVDGADIGARQVLVSVAAEAGMDADSVSRRLEDGTDREAVEREVARAHEMGIDGVPCFILDRRNAVMGAQDAATLASAIDRTLAETAVPADQT